MKNIIKKILPHRLKQPLLYIKYRFSKIANHAAYISRIAGKEGIEVGGPSLIFRTKLPLYDKVQSLDGVNFAENTIWEGTIAQGKTYHYFGKKNGFQFTAEASDLSIIKDASYDFLISSNCLEHVANPIRALREWSRIMKPGGHIILVLPNKNSNFDHRRPTTKFDHLLEDYKNNVSEKDLTHLNEILELHDLSRDPPAGDFESFKKRSLDNFNNRTLHHHIFDIDLMKKMLTHIGLEIVETSETKNDFYVLAEKPMKLTA